MFSVRRRGGLNPIIQQGSPTTLGLTAYCLLDTTLIGYNSDGEYELFISFTAAPEVPVVGPFRFELNNVGVTLPDDEDAVAQYDLSSYQLRSEKGLAEGYATLGLDGLVPESQLPVISGGGTPPSALPRAEYLGSGVVTIAAGGQERLPFANLGFGSVMLDVTDPVVPTVLVGGIYAVTVLIQCFTIPAAITPSFRLKLSLDRTDWDAVSEFQSGDLGTWESTLLISLSLTFYVPEAGEIVVTVFNGDTVSHDWNVQELMIQAIALDA